jgi:hypothetical protein
MRARQSKGHPILFVLAGFFAYGAFAVGWWRGAGAGDAVAAGAPMSTLAVVVIGGAVVVFALTLLFVWALCVMADDGRRDE